MSIWPDRVTPLYMKEKKVTAHLKRAPANTHTDHDKQIQLVQVERTHFIVLSSCALLVRVETSLFAKRNCLRELTLTGIESQVNVTVMTMDNGSEVWAKKQPDNYQQN